MKTKLTMLALLACSIAIGQIPPSSWMLIGGICFDNDKSNDYGYLPATNQYIELQNSQSTFALKAGVGYAFAQNQLAGLKIGYETNKDVQERLVSGINDEIETTTITDNRFFIEPFYRYYYFCAPQFAIIGQLRVPLVFGSGKTEIEGPFPSSNESPSSFGIGAWVNPKFAWFPKDNWSVEAGVGRLGFYSEGYDDANNNRYKNSQFSAKLWMFRPSLSIAYFFGRGQEKAPL